MAEEVMNFEILNYAVKDSNDNYAIVQADVVNVGKNFNQTNFSKEAIKAAIPTILNTPLIGIYNGITDDFKSHAHTESEQRQTYAVGVIPESANPHFEIRDNGLEYLVVDIVVWKSYFPQFFHRMAENEKDDIKTTISMEVLADETEKMEDGTIDIKSFRFVGLCLLGADVKPRNSRRWIKSY
jgi:hypothetical protein